MQPANGVAGWRRGEEVIDLHVARAIAGFGPFRTAGAAAVKPHPLLIGLGEQLRIGDDHILILRAVHGLAHSREGVSESLTTYTSVHAAYLPIPSIRGLTPEIETPLYSFVPLNLHQATEVLSALSSFFERVQAG